MFFGGARGGGKTDGVLGHWAGLEQELGPALNAIMFRRTTVSSEDAIDRSKQIYGQLGARFNSSNLSWRMPNGGRVGFKYLDKVEDAMEWQGRNLSHIWIEEAGQYPTPDPIDRLFGVMRSAYGIPVQMIMTANPGGPGQLWLRDRFELSPLPRAPKRLTVTINEGTIEAAVIPSRIQDNQLLMLNDPGYINRLKLVGSKKLVDAWLAGDWSAVEGAFFEEWSEARHVLHPFTIPRGWLRFRSMDWGFASPFSVGWWAVCGDDYITEDHRILPRGALIRYREWYGASAPQKGLRLTADEVALGILDRDDGDRFAYSVLDPSAFAQDGGPSIAERMLGRGVTFRRADNRRIAQKGAMGGWDLMRARLRGYSAAPMVYCFSHCKASIRTIPVLQHDTDRLEDLDTEGEDHAADEWRYACMSRPWIPAEKPADPRRQKPGQVVLEGPPKPRSSTRIVV